MQYSLMLRYPNGRTFRYQEESKYLPNLGHEFNAFGHRWRIEREVVPTRRHPASFYGSKALACHPVNGEASVQTPKL